MASGTPAEDDLRERLIDAALRVIAEHGIAELTVRRLAEAADTSTMGVYSRFGGRAGVLRALYTKAYDMLADALAAVPPSADPVADLIALALAYRDFALASPDRYTFMFDQASAGFQPDEPLRTQSFQVALDPVLTAVRRAAPEGVTALRAAYCLWCVMHGLLGLELAKVPGTPLPAVDFQPDDQTARRMYLAGCTAMLTGLGFAYGVR
ncbi:MAG TPA: TetR/AcrR family transcriptional regulator [Pseudonocardiaceae bacterium]